LLLADVNATQSLQHIWISKVLAAKARNSDSFNVLLFSFFVSLSQEMAVTNIADALKVSFLFGKDPLERF